MLRGCYGNRPSCLAKDLPSEVGLTMKNRWKQKQKLSYQGSFFRWWPALTLRGSLINVQSHDYAMLYWLKSLKSFYQISYMMDRAGELKEFIWRWVWSCHIFPIARDNNNIFPIARWETIYHKTRSQVGRYDGDHWAYGWGGGAIVSLAQAQTLVDEWARNMTDGHAGLKKLKTWDILVSWFSD